MRKRLLMGLLVLAFAFSVAACNKDDKTANEPNNEAGTSVEESSDSKFIEEEGKLIYIDLEASPFEDGGLKTIVEKGSTGKAKFIKTDAEGKEDVNYYIFDYATNTFEKYNYVSAMGNGYYYYYDLEAKELTKVENQNHEDSTEGLKKAKRWDGAVSSVEEDIATLEEYFINTHEKTIKEFIQG